MTLTYRNALVPSFCFAPACSLSIHSSSPPTAGRPLFRAVIHPVLDHGPGDPRPPHRVPSACGGPEQRQYRTRFKRQSVPQDEPDTPVTDRAGPDRQTCLTPDAGERDSDRFPSFRDSPEPGGDRPITSVGPSQPLGQDRPPPLSTHPNTRVRSKSSCRVII